MTALALIYKLASKEEKYFYKTSHLVHYLIKYHTIKDRNKKQKLDTIDDTNITITTSNTQPDTQSSISIQTRTECGFVRE